MAKVVWVVVSKVVHYVKLEELKISHFHVIRLGHNPEEVMSDEIPSYSKSYEGKVFV